IRLCDAKVRVEHEEGLADRVEDVEQEPVGGGGPTGDEARIGASDHCGVFHVVQGKKRDDRRQSHDRSSRPAPPPEFTRVCGARAGRVPSTKCDATAVSQPWWPDLMITVAIVDDNRLVREALAAMLGRLPDVEVVAAASANAEVLDRETPDVLLLDAGLGDED